MSLTKRQQQKEDTKKIIIEAAYKIFAEKGFAATTSDIAKASNVSHGTIFVHFPTRDDLIICILNDFSSSVGVRLHELTDESENLAEVLRAHCNAIKEHEDFYVRLITENHLLPTEVRNTFIGIQSVIAFHFSKFIEGENGTNCFKKLPTHIIFNTWIGLIHHYLQNNDLFAPNSSVIERHGEELIDSFLELIKK